MKKLSIDNLLFKTKKHFCSKLIIWLLLLFQVNIVMCQMNNFSCEMTSIDPLNASNGTELRLNLLEHDALDFFKTDQNCQNTVLKVNYILLYKSDGTGNFDLSDPLEADYFNDLISITNNTITNLINPPTCSTEANFSNLTLDFEVVQVNNDFAWDVDHCDPRTTGSPCGDDQDLCKNSQYAAAINSIIAGFDEFALNVFFPMDGSTWNTYYADNSYTNVACNMRPTWDIFFWLGRFPTHETLTQFSKAQISNLYMEYLWRKNRPECVVDSEGNPFDPSQINLWLQNDAGKTIAHELGHNLSLTHDESVCSQNFMNGGFGVSLTETQIGRINRALSIKNVRNSINHTINVDCEYVWNDPSNRTLVIDKDTKINRNIRIASGNTIRVENQLCLPNSGKIIVEKNASLIIDGGRIFSCGDQWQGIIIEGDSGSGSQANAGKVILGNNAIIENAKTAISMNPSHIPWPQTQDMWGGLVKAENSTIRNCHRAVEFMKYGVSFINDESYFKNCTFENMEFSAITIWANNGVVFEGCTFDNVQDNGIYAYDSKVEVYDHCVFNNMQTGVNVFHTYPAVYSSVIGSTLSDPNEFLCDNYGVYARTNGNAAGLEVINNNFVGGDYGVHIDGYSAYTIGHNDFLGEYAAVEPMATGSTHFNNVMNNNISSSTYGSHAVYDNYNLKYDDNCFGYNTLSDVYVNSGIIFLDQGDKELANGNCFTKGGVPEIDNTGNPEIQLWVWKNEPTNSCEYPTTVNNDPSFNVVVKPQAENYTNDNCGSMFTPGIINIKTFCNGPFKTKQEKLDKITEIEAIIAAIESNVNYSQAYKDYLIRIYKRCLDKIKIEVIIIILEPAPGDDGSMRMQKTEEAIAYASGLNTFELKLFAYGLMVDSDQLSRARSYLNGLSALEGEEANFVTAQNIYLDFLLDRKNYVLSSQNESTLYNIGMGISPLDGYGRSIYEVITGNHIDLNIPSPHNSLLPRSRTGKQQDVLVNIYPNPSANGQININIVGQNEMIFQVYIYDLLGNPVYFQNMKQGNKTLSTKEWNAGIYVVNVKTDQGHVMVQKVAITN